MKLKAISNRFVRLVAPYFIGLFSLLSVSANNFPASSITSSVVNDPVIELNGDNPQLIDVGGTYEELNATSDDVEDGDLTSQISIGGVSGVNTNVLGDYIVKYSVTDLDGNTTIVDRTVRVVDRQNPVVELTGASQISIEVGSTYYELGATATDNYDPSFSVTNSIVLTGTVTEEVLGEYSITYSAQDSSGNVGTVQRIVNVVDTTSPIIDITGENPVTITLGNTYNDEGATANDNYDGDLTSEIVQTGSVNNSVVGENFIYYNVSDAAGNTATQKVRTVHVVDDTNPTITLLGLSTLTHEVGTIYADPGATANDNYDGDLSSQISTDNNVNPNILGTYTFEYTVQDSSDNTAQEQRTVQVVDTVDPVITLTGNETITIEYQTTYTDAGATASDNYDGNINSSLTSSSTVDIETLGEYAFTYTVSDSSLNTAQASRTVFVVDTTPPVITLNGSAEINLQVGDSYNDGGATAVDAHDGDVTADITMASSVDTSSVGVYYVTYTVSDNKGNNTQATRTVIVGSPPVITLQGANPLQVEAGGTYVELGANAFDNPDGDVSDQISISESVNTSVLGPYSVQYSVIDSDGNSTVLFRAVEVSDTTSPNIELVGDEQMTIEVNGSFTDPGATALDSFDGDLTDQISDIGTVNTSSLGNYSVTYQVSDSSGNTADVSRQVTVSDTNVPVISLTGSSPVTIEVGTSYTDEGATATDDFEGNITASIIDVSNVDTTTVGTYSVVYNVSDSFGNVANQVTRIVEVVDSQAPVLSFVGGATITHEAKTVFNIPTDVTATDVYDGDLSSAVVVSGIVNQNLIGSYNLSYSVTDSSENTAQLTRTVNVVDTINPEITLTGDNPLYINLGETFTEPGYSANDNYDGNITSAVVQSGLIDTSSEGTYFLNYNVIDSSSNAAIQQIREVIVGSPPVITLNGNNPMYLEYQETYIEPNATATDGGVDLSSSISISGAVNENQLGTYSVIYSVTDSDGNSVTETREVILRDTTKPVVTLNGVATQTIEFGNAYNEQGATAIDNYDGSLTVTLSGAVNTSILGAYTIDYQVTDSQGNVADVITRTVTLVDTQAPTMSIIGDLSQTIQVKSSYTEQGVSAIDNYDGGIPFSSIMVTGAVDVNTVGTYPIDYDVSDSSGNNAVTITRTVVVEDTEAPVIVLAGDANITLEADSPYSDAGATVTDNYDTGLIASVDLSSLDLSTIGVYTLTYTVSDSSGNTATPEYRTITVVDTQAPTITLVGNPTIDVQAGTTYVDPGFAATDIYDGDLTAQVLVSETVDTSILGATTLSYDVSDSSNNDAPTKTRTVRVVDTTKPVITLQGAAEILLEVGDSFTDPGYTATDNYDGIITNNVIVANTVDTTTPGRYIVTYNLVDSEGNIADEQTRTVVVGSPPSITLNGPSVVTLEVGNTYTDQGALASDDDDGPLGSTSDSTSRITVNGVNDVNTGLIGTYYIQYSVTDSDGNTTIVQRTVDVVDTTLPTITLDDESDIEIEVFSDDYVDDTVVTVSDNYDSTTTLTPTDVVVSDDIDEDVVGTYTISYNLQDSSGNAAPTKMRTVRVVDTTAPELSLVGESSIFISKGSSYTDQGATATDNYDGVISADVVTSGSVNNNQIGSYTLTYNVQDASGNDATPITRTVTVGPSVDATASPNPVCYGETVTLGSTNTDLVDENGDAYRFEWSATPSTGTLLGTQHIITANVTQNTVFRLEVYDVNDVLVGSDESEVEVNPLPVFTIQPTTTLCAGDTIDLGDGIVAETGFTYQWSSLNGYSRMLANPPPHTPTADDTFTLTVTTDAGCQDTQSFDVVIVDKPVISFIDDDFTICEDETFTITTGVATVQNSNSYVWSAPAGYGNFDTPNSLTPIFTPSSVAENAGVVTLTLTATDQSPCTGSKSESITLNITPLGNISLSPVNAVVCSSEDIELDIAGANYDATSLVASPASAIVNTATNKIFYTPTTTDISNGYVDIFVTADPLSPCSSTLTSPTQRITITPEAEVAIANSPLVVCYDPSTPQFFSLATIGATISNIDSFIWEDMGGGGFFSAGNSTNPMSWSYQPGPQAIADGTTQLKLKAVPNDPCSSTPEMEAFLTVILDQNPEIIVKTGDKILCEGVYNEINSDIVDFENDTQSTFAWTGGDGNFVQSSSKFPFYRPGPTDLSTGVVSLVVTVTPNSGGCSTAVSQAIEFTVNKDKIVNLGPDIDMCESDGNYFLVGDFITDSSSPPNVITPTTGITWGILNNDGDGTFSETTALNPVYTPGLSDIDRGQVTLQMTYSDGSCNDVSDTVILNIIRTPFADLGGDIEICAGDSTPITGVEIRPVGASIQWGIVPDASGVTVQNDTSLFPTLVADPNASGTYQLTLEVNPEIIDGENCGAQIVETVTVEVIPPPTVQLTGTPVICEGDDFTYDVADITIAATNSSGFVWSTMGDGTFDGGNATSTLERPTYTPGNSDINAGNVELRLDVLPEADCHTTEYFDTINLEITPVPSIQGPNEIEFCKTTPLVVDIGSYLSVNNEDRFTYQWTSSSGTASGTFSGTGLSATYTPSSFDIDRKSVILSLVATETSCAATDSKDIAVYFIDPPEIDAGPDEVILCEDEVNYQTAGSYTIDPRVTAGVSYVWSSSGDGEFLPSNTETDPLYVPGPNDRLNRKVDDTSVGVQLTFKLVSTGACEVEVQDIVELFFEPKPEITLPPDFEICGSLTPSLSANVNEFVDESSYFWTTSGDGTFNGSDQNTSTDDTPTYFPGTNDLFLGNVTISVSVNGKNACSSTTVQDSQTITFIAQPTADAGPDTTICETGGVIDVENTVAEPATNYSQLKWTIIDGQEFGTIENDNTLSPKFNPLEPAVTQGFVDLLLTVEPTNHSTCNQSSGLCCGVAKDTLRVNLQKEPVILIPSNQTICQTDLFTIFSDQVQIEHIPSYSIQWFDDGAGNLTNSDTLTPTYTPTASETGDVTLTMSITPTNPNVCTGLVPIERSFVLTIEPLPVVYAGDDVTLCEGESYTTLSADVDFTTDYQWTRDGEGSISPDTSSENVTYTPSDLDYVRGYVILTLTATPEGNCTGKPDVVDSFRITYSPPPTVRVDVGDINGDGVEEYPSSFCGSESYTFDAAQVVGQNVVSYNWETIGGDGTFSDDTDEQTPTYTPGNGDKANGSVTIRVTAVGQGGCAVDTFDFDLTILPEPTLDLTSSPTSVCIDSTINLEATTNLLAGDYNISWTVDPADGLITQEGNLLKPTFEPIRTGTVTITATLSSNDPCATQNIIKTIDVDVGGLPEITDFPTDDEICFDERVTVAGVTTNAFVDSVFWEAKDQNGNPVGTFGDPTDENPLYTPASFTSTELNESQVVTLTMTAYATSPCTDEVKQSFTLTLNPSPSASMNSTDEVCADSFYQVLDATIDFNTASSYIWSKQGDGTLTGVDSLTPTYEPGPTDLVNGEFTLELAVQGLLNPDGIPNCSDLVITKTVTIVQTPVVELSLDTADYCTSDNPDVDDTNNHDNPILVQVQNLQNIQTINWSTTSEDGIITPSSDGSAIFYPSQEDYDNGQVTVTLTADPIAPCIGSVEDSLIITFKQAPVVDADITSENNILSPVCEDEPAASTQLNASALNYQSIQWTSSGTGSFDIDNILNPVYEFSTQDFDNGSVTLTITVEGDVNCSPKSDTVKIDLVKKPTVDLGNALIKCGKDLDEIIISDVVISGEYESLSWYTPGPGNLEDETTLNPKYLPNPGEHGEVNLYLTIYPKSPCLEPISIPNPKTIIISEPPSVDIGLDTIELCEEDEEITLPDSSLGGAFAENYSNLLWTATGGSGLLTNEDTLTPTYKPSISDWNSLNDVILKLTVTGEDGCDSIVDEDTITLKLIPKPVANAGPDVVICATNTITSLPNQITTGFATLELESYESFYWSVSSNATGVLVQDATDPAAAKYTVGEGETGTITLTLTAIYEDDSNIPGGCILTDEDTMNITINPAPIANIGLTELVCDDQSIELQGTAQNHTSVEWSAYVNSGGTKSPATGSFVSNNDLTTTFIPALLDFNYESIIIELTAFGLDGCLDHTVEEEITIPYVNAGDDDQICGLEPYTLLNAETNGTNYRWQIIDGNGTFSGQQTSTLLNPVYTPSQLDLDRGSVTLQLTVDPSGDCAGSDPISDEIEISLTPPPSISVIDHSICQGIEIQNADGSFEIDPTEFAVTGAIPLNYDTILWEVFSGSGSIAVGTENNVVPTFIPEKTQSEEDTTVLKVTVTGSNACGDQPPVIDYVNLFVKPAAELFAGENDSVCENQTQYTLSGATSDNVQNFYWTENGTGEIISGQNTLTPTYEFGTGEVGTVTFTLTADGTGACDNTLTRTFELTIIEQPTATIDPVAVVCSDQVVSLSSTALNYKSIEEDIGTGEPGYEGLFWTSSGSGTFSDSNILNPTYNPSENDILNGVTLYLRAEAIDPCGNDFTTSVDVTFSDAIVVKVRSGDPTPDGHYIDSMCGFVVDQNQVAVEEFYSLDEAYTENADTWSWSTTNGTGSFSNAEIQNPIYTPSDQDRNNPDPIELVLTAEGGENCLPKTSTLKLTIDKLPEIINPVPSIYHCLNDEEPLNISVEGSFNISKYGIITTNSVDLTTVEWITDGDGSFVIGSDVLDPVYQPSPTDIQNGVTLKIRGYGENSCGSEFLEKEIEVTFSPKPIIEYIVDNIPVNRIEVCESSPTPSVSLDGTVLTDLNSIVWSTTNGTGTFNSTTATNPIYTPSEADFDLPDGVVLKANAIGSNYPGTCAVEELEIVLDLVKKPIINATKTILEFCESENEVVIGLDEDGVNDLFLSNVNQSGAEGFYDIKWVVSPNAHGSLTSPDNKLVATYQPDEKDYEQGVILTLIAYGKGDCNFPDEETFQINFKRNLTIYPGDSGSICSGEDFPIEGATVDGYDEGSIFEFEWIAQFSSDINTPDDPTDTPNGIFIDNPQGNKLKPTYRPGTNDIGKTVYIYLKPENEPSSCYVNNKKITLDIGKEVSLYAGPDLKVCGDYGPVPIHASSNTSVGEPNPLVSWSVFSINGNPVGNQLGISDTSSLTTTYSPGSIEYVNGISTVTLSLNAAGNFCPGNSSSDTMTITYYEPIDAYAGDPTSICGTDNPVLINDAVILAGENSYESIEWRVINGFGPDPENNTTLKPTYQPHLLDATLPNRQVRIGLFITPKQFDPVDQDGLILDYSCSDPSPFIKSIFISSAITGTGSIVGDSVVCADNNIIAYSIGGDLDGVDQYQWSVPEGATYENGTNENSAIINLLFNSFTENSTKTIGVIASNGCGESRNLSKSINIKAQTQLALDSGQDSDEQELCFGDSLDPIIYQIEGGAKNLGEALEIVWYIGANEITDSSLISLLPNLNQSPDKLTITGQFSNASIAGIYNYKIQYVDDEGDDCFVNDSLKTGTLTLIDVPTVNHDVTKGDLIQEVCEGTDIDNIEFIFDTTITEKLNISWAGGAPVGINTSDPKISPFTIQGNLAVRLGEATSTYAYTVTPIDSSGCQGESTSGSLVVEASNSVIAISSTPPTICNGEAISYVYSFSDSIVEPFDINWKVFDENGSLIGDYTSPPLGSGINDPIWNFTLNTITISGVPVSNIDANRTYSFELVVPPNCDSLPITQPFTVSAKPRINIYTSPLDLDGDGDPSNDPTSGQTVQTLCEGDNLEEIFVQVSGSNLFDPYLEGNPIGVSISESSTTSGVWIISGSNLNAGGTNEYEYSVKIRNADQCEDTLEGFKINFDANHSIDLISLVSTESQDDLCAGSSLNPIIYRYSSASNPPIVTWRAREIDDDPTDPTSWQNLGQNSNLFGVSVTKNASDSTIIISGEPIADDYNGDNIVTQSVYEYTILTSSSQGCSPDPSDLISESLSVTPTPSMSRSSQSPQTLRVCEGELIEIFFDVSSDNLDFELTQVPDYGGVLTIQTTSDPNKVKLTGVIDNITEELNLDYTLIAKDNDSQCSSSAVGGTIVVEDKHELSLIGGSNNQQICEGSAITPIVYEYSGGAVSVNYSVLPPGLDIPDIDPIAKTITFRGSPSSQVSVDTEKIFTIQTSGIGSLCEKAVDTIKINLTPQPRFANLPQNYVVCEGDSVDFIELGLLDGADDVIVSWENNVEPPGTINYEIDNSTSTSTFRFTGELSGVSEEKTYGFTLIALNSSTGCESTPRQGQITLQNEHELNLELGSKFQEICEGEEIEPIVYKWGGGATSASVIGLPTGLEVDRDLSNKRITISGEPTVLISQDEELKFTIKTANNSDSCEEKIDTLTLGLIKQPSIRVLTGTQFQSRICEGVAIDSIVFETFNGATNAFISWEDNIKPPGDVNLYDNENGTYVLKGTIDGFDQDQTYSYTIEAINLAKGCESAALTGSLGVQKGHELRRLSSFSSTQQKICEGELMASEIIYEFGGGASSAEVIGLPPGLDWNIDNTMNRLTISGTPVVDVSEVTEYEYDVISLGNDCNPLVLEGKLTVEPDAEISLESPIATANQFICEGFPIEEITYTFGGGAIDVIYNGLPAGLTPVITYDPVDPSKVSKLTISGTPNVNVSDDTEFEYSIKALNNNGCFQPELKGTITIKANAELTLLSSSLSKDQIVCIGTDIIPVNIGYVNSEIPSVSGMPAGLYTTTDAANGILTIQGSITELQLGNPNRILTIIGTNINGCRSQEIEIDIEVQPSYSIKPTRTVDDPLDTSNPSGASYVKNITCYDNNDGEIMVNLEVGGSSTNYIYSWTGPNNYVNTTQKSHIKNLSAGIYVVQVEAQGARDCSISQTYTITEPDPVNIITNEIRPVSCTGSEDGFISVTIDGGNENFYRNFIWEVLQEDVSCTTYTVRLRDNDNDGIFDVVDADIDNNGSTDPGKTDVNGDGMIDEANDSNYSFGTVSYQSCDGVFIQNNILRGEFSANGIYQVCAIPNTITADAKLDHDLDPDTDNIASVTISGGTASCSAGTWTKIDRLKGSSLASNLIEGIYRLTVIEGPDLNDIESNDLESLRNDPDICVFEEIYELPKDQILYGSVRVDETYCSLSGGYIDIDVNQSAGEIYFYYDGVRVANTDIEVIAAEFGINTYRVLIQNPNSNGSFEIRNATGCGVVVAQDLLDTNVLTPIISYTSPELEKYGTISERSNILFTLAGNTSYYRVEWDFGDASPVAIGERVSHQYFADGTYTVTVYVYNASGCYSTSTKEVIVGKGYTILMPNAFSPNGDNINEIIGPVFTGLKAVEYHIYNSQGILVYQEFVSEDNLSPNGTIEIMGWDGENSDPSSNFYVYKIIGTRINEELVTRTGTIFLIE